MNRYVELNSKITQTLVKSSKIFIEKVFNFVVSVVKNKKLIWKRGECYLTEILHSIFFIGFIHRPKIYPEEVLQEELGLILRNKFPDAFQMYKTELPSRPPYSVLLDLVVEVTGDQNVSAVLDKLLELNADMHVPTLQEDGTVCGNDFSLASTVVSYTYFQNAHGKTRNYFGASVSCRGEKARQIFIDLSCIKTWNQNVAFAVYLASNDQESIRLPQKIYSTAYHMYNNPPSGIARPIQTYHQIRPCLKCVKCFPNIEFFPPYKNNSKVIHWEYGNCAEYEAVSKLLNTESWVNDRVEGTDLTSLQVFLQERKHRLAENLGNNQYEF
ncbi:hypothetical protein GN956_G1943 [Arapaima gigas]